MVYATPSVLPHWFKAARGHDFGGEATWAWGRLDFEGRVESAKNPESLYVSARAMDTLRQRVQWELCLLPSTNNDFIGIGYQTKSSISSWKNVCACAGVDVCAVPATRTHTLRGCSG